MTGSKIVKVLWSLLWCCSFDFSGSWVVAMRDRMRGWQFMCTWIFFWSFSTAWTRSGSQVFEFSNILFFLYSNLCRKICANGFPRNFASYINNLHNLSLTRCLNWLWKYWATAFEFSCWETYFTWTKTNDSKHRREAGLLYLSTKGTLKHLAQISNAPTSVLSGHSTQ